MFQIDVWKELHLQSTQPGKWGDMALKDVWGSTEMKLDEAEATPSAETGGGYLAPPAGTACGGWGAERLTGKGVAWADPGRAAG